MMKKVKIKKNFKKIKNIIPNFKKKQLPKSITFILFRILLVIPIAFLLYSKQYAMGLGLFMLASVIGYLDMYFRRYKDYGFQIISILDPFADKILILATSFMLWKHNLLPMYAFIVFWIKDVLMIIGGLVVLKKNKRTMFKKNMLDKITTFFQSLALLLIMASELIVGTTDVIILEIAVVLTAISGIYSIFKSGIKFEKKKTDLEHIKLSSMIKLPDYITLMNVAAGLFSVIFTINGQYSMAMIMLLVAVVADYFDGKVARAIKREGDFGKELDSLADTVSFGVAPTIFAFTIVPSTPLSTIAFTIFLFCGILRLARFNVTEFSGTYEGMPITTNGLLIPVIHFAGVPLMYYPYIYLVLGILMVSSISLKKI
jgi:CDP-diacylglycerol--serine O-phosphatidyltransferase